MDNENKNETKENDKPISENEEEEEEEEDIDPMVAMYKRINEEKYFDIKFKGHILYSLDNSYCIYNKNLIYISYYFVIYIIGISLFFEYS